MQDPNRLVEAITGARGLGPISFPRTTPTLTAAVAPRIAECPAAHGPAIRAGLRMSRAAPCLTRKGQGRGGWIEQYRCAVLLPCQVVFLVTRAAAQTASAAGLRGLRKVAVVSTTATKSTKWDYSG